MADKEASGHPHAGLLYGLSAYTMWGFVPLYFRAVSHVPPVLVLCHRVVWSVLFMSVVVSIRGEWKKLWPVLCSRRSLVLLSLAAVLIALNWLVFIYAISKHELLQASLGYFVNPLLSIALGVIFLRERLRTWQWLAVIIVVAAVTNLALRDVKFPWIAVSLAASFGLYGLVRKKLDINSLHGLTLETAILFPAALIALALMPGPEMGASNWGLLSLSGIVTAVPLLFFGAAVRRLRLSTLGFLQYIGPTLQFLLAVCWFDEALDRTKLASFALCWLAIGVYIADSVANRQPQLLADEPE